MFTNPGYNGICCNLRPCAAAQKINEVKNMFLSVILTIAAAYMALQCGLTAFSVPFASWTWLSWLYLAMAAVMIGVCVVSARRAVRAYKKQAEKIKEEQARELEKLHAKRRALYLDEGGVPLVAERSIDVSCQLELPEDCRVAARAVCPEEVQGSLTDRGIEVRFPVDFRAEAAQRVKRVCVSAGKINTDAPKETTGAPSLVLRCLGKQETAWDLAKRYNTTIGVILAANQLETEGDISRDQLLLIPRKRT